MLAGFSERRTLYACILATGAIFVDISIVNVLLPEIRNDLHTSLAQEQWIVNAYLVTMTAFVLPAGVMGDLYGHRRMLQIGLATFAFATLLVGLAPTANFEIGARGIQGIAAALMTPASIAILRTSIAPERQARAVGLWVTGTSLSAAIAPAFGGSDRWRVWLALGLLGRDSRRANCIVLCPRHPRHAAPGAPH